MLKRWQQMLMFTFVFAGLFLHALYKSPACLNSRLTNHSQVWRSDFPQSRLTVTESLPIGEFDLKFVSNETRSTALILTTAVHNCQHSLDITAMYWNLLASEDRKLLNRSRLHELGADAGVALYEALESAAKRNVRIRILGGKLNGNNISAELAHLVNTYPNVRLQIWDSELWYGGGIMHQKVWIFDQRSFYLGSANMDWKSLTQVLELGVYVEDNIFLTSDIQKIFDIYWAWTIPAFNEKYTSSVFHSKMYQLDYKVPSWSVLRNKTSLLPEEFSPFSSGYNQHNQISTSLNEQSAQFFFSASPNAALVGSRLFDEDALVYTIQSAREYLYLNVMDYDYLSWSYFLEGQHSPVYWSALNTALYQAVFTRGVHVKLLISKWAHSKKQMLRNLKQMQQQYDEICHPKSNKERIAVKTCLGSFEIRIFIVNGWNETSPDTLKYAPFSRVNHGKYIVSESRANIGTSNMLWSYFYATAGISLNTNHADVVSTVSLIFLRNFNSQYAVKDFFIKEGD